MRVDILDPNAVDFDEIVALQRKSFEGARGESQLAGTQTAEYYNWKYLCLGGAAKIAQARDADGLAAMSAIFSLPLICGSLKTTGWQICDIATSPSKRGNGCFGFCLDALKETLSDGEIFFGFPNVNSAPGVRKIGWKTIDVLRVFAGIVPNLSERPHIEQIETFGHKQDFLAGLLAKTGRVMIDRSASYMNHRYCSMHRPLYSSFVYQSEDGLQGFLVVRPLDIFGLRFCIVMECFAINQVVQRELLLHAGSWSLKNRCNFTLAFNNLSGAFGLMDCGLIPISQRFSPRPLILMGQLIGSQNSLLTSAPWTSCIGDWDGL